MTNSRDDGRSVLAFLLLPERCRKFPDVFPLTSSNPFEQFHRG
jgi:hypothetical protein